VNGQDISEAVASSTATTTVEAIVAGPFANATQTLKDALASAVSAISELAQRGVRELGVAAHAGLGIFDTLISQTITATVVNADTVNTKTLCLEDVCVTKSQLQNLLNGQSSQPAPTPSGNTGTSTPVDPSAPVVTVNGNNPATVQVGSVYSDLGVTITDDQDQNLGYLVSLDGAATITPDQLVVDTSVAGTHTITYTVSDTQGNVGQASRTVTVEAPAAVLPPSVTGAATSTDSGATTSTATTTDTGVSTSTSTPQQ
jgi:hypothetical protein